MRVVAKTCISFLSQQIIWLYKIFLNCTFLMKTEQVCQICCISLANKIDLLISEGKAYTNKLEENR